LKIDNNFSGTTVVRDCDLIRCGGFDPGWGWRAAFQLCLHRRSISGLEISNVNIQDSLSDGFGVVAPGSAHGEGTLSDAWLENVDISNSGIAATGRHGLAIREDSRGSMTMKNSQIVDTQNSSADFRIINQ
jgi:hypothetical protein